MFRNKSNWLVIILLILIVLLLIPQVFSNRPMSLMHSGYGNKGYGMMGPGMFGFGWIIPVIILILVIAAGVWLGNIFSRRSKFHQIQQKESCPNCSKHIEGDWQTCPYCSETLE